jgi:Carboxypeptidase regulatory-like domain
MGDIEDRSSRLSSVAFLERDFQGQFGRARSSAKILRVLRGALRDLHWLTLCLLFGCLPSLGQSVAQSSSEILPAQDVSSQQDRQALGNISGTVLDQNGNFILAARVKLACEGHAGEQEVASDENGHFNFNGVAAGPFELTIAADGFATQTRPGILHSGETFEMPDISLVIAAATTDVQVTVTKYELAEEQVKVEEKQRVLGFIPNFYVSYNHDAPSLAAKQKFELAWRTSVDPITLLAVGALAGIEQADDGFSGYGQGAQGYAKRYGAAFADSTVATVVGSAILPSLLKQDPRYFYKGSGSTRSRILYALANSVICKGDNGHWQANYSGILGSLAAGGISNLYYPAANRNGVGLTFENTLAGIGTSGIENLFQEFLVRRLTPHAQDPQNGMSR